MWEDTFEILENRSTKVSPAVSSTSALVPLGLGVRMVTWTGAKNPDAQHSRVGSVKHRPPHTVLGNGNGTPNISQYICLKRHITSPKRNPTENSEPLVHESVSETLIINQTPAAFPHNVRKTNSILHRIQRCIHWGKTFPNSQKSSNLQLHM